MSRFHSSHNGENATFVKLRAWVDLGPHYHRYMTGLLHLHIRHCSSAASAVRRLPSAVRTATPAFKFGRRAFSVAGPAAWNSLPDYLPDPSRSFDSFRRDLKTSFLVLHSALEALRLCAI